MTGGALDARVVVDRRGFRLDVALTAAPGETVAVMGPSGAGKSTLLGALAGLTRLGGGHVRIDGAEAHAAPHRRGVVLLGQEPRLFPHLSARGNVAFGLRAHGAPRRAARATADGWLARVGLAGLGDRRPAALSGGQQQRVALARALATSPRVLLLDEPLTSLDPETAGEIRALVAEQVRGSGVTTVVVTHDAVDAASLADRLLVVEAGAVTQQGPVRDVLSAPATRFAAVIAGVNRLVGVSDGGRWRGGEVVLSGADAVTAADGEPLAAFVRPGAVRLEPASDAAASGEGARDGGADATAAGDGTRGTEPGAAAGRGARGVTPGAAEAPASVSTWTTRIVRLEQTPAGVRVHTAEPAVAVDVPVDVIAARGLTVGAVVRLSVAARDVRLAPAGTRVE